MKRLRTLQIGNILERAFAMLESTMKNQFLNNIDPRPVLRHFIFVFITSFSIVGSAADSKPVELSTTSLGVSELLTRGSLADEKGDVTTALKYYREAVNHFDRGRPMMAEALFRVAESYLSLGAEESASAAFRRISDEFSDVVDVLEKVPAKYRPQDLVSKVQADSIASFEESSQNRRGGNVASDDPRTIDPRYEERRLLLERQQRRLERARQRVETAEDQILIVSEKLRMVQGSSAFTIPEEARPEDLTYRELKMAWGEAFRGKRSDENEILLDQLERRADEWVQRFFIPSLQASIEITQSKYEELKSIYDHEMQEYKEWLRRIQEHDQKAASKLKAQSQAAASFSIIGKVRNPNVYPIPDSRQITLQHAVAMAGGLVANSKESIVVYRDGVAHKVSYHEQLQLRTDDQFRIENGDVVKVLERFF